MEGIKYQPVSEKMAKRISLTFGKIVLTVKVQIQISERLAILISKKKNLDRIESAFNQHKNVDK